MEQITLILGVVLNLLLEYLPGLADWFAKMPANQKRLVAGVVSALLGLLLWAFGCEPLGLNCTTTGLPDIIGAIAAVVLTAIGSQALHPLTKRTKK